MIDKNRFYKNVTCSEIGGGFGIFLDGRRLVTPAKNPLVVPEMALAQLIAAEWAGQSETVKPATMPITRLVNVAIDRTPATRNEMAIEVRKYASSDLLCYRINAPQKLAQKQAEIWDPILDWAKTDLSVEMVLVIDSLKLVQSDATLQTIQETALQLDDIRLTALMFVTALCGSAILALALLRGHLTALQIFEAIRIEENHNAEIWGHDYEDLDKAKEKLADLVAAEQTLRVLD